MGKTRIIENKETSIDITEESGKRKTTYFDLIKECFNTPPAGGFSRDDIKKRNKIEDKLTGTSVELDHDEFYYVKKTCNDTKWYNRHKDIENFLDYLDDVK